MSNGGLVQKRTRGGSSAGQVMRLAGPRAHLYQRLRPSVGSIVHRLASAQTLKRQLSGEMAEPPDWPAPYPEKGWVAGGRRQRQQVGARGAPALLDEAGPLGWPGQQGIRLATAGSINQSINARAHCCHPWVHAAQPRRRVSPASPLRTPGPLTPCWSQPVIG